jgi:hypothetical protein
MRHIDDPNRLFRFFYRGEIKMNHQHVLNRSTLVLALAAALSGNVSVADSYHGVTHVPNANEKITGMAVPNILSHELIESVVAQGSMRLENISGLTSYYGYDNDGTMLPAAGALQNPGSIIEATKTEPDKNTYLRLHNQHGADRRYNYGTRFLFQGHESGTKGENGLKQGYITRINLDADGAHRVTLLATADQHGNTLPTFDGSTWYPWSQQLLFTAELSGKGGVWQATPDYPSRVEDISGALGRGGYEGIQADSDGNLWIVEDVGGKSGSINRHAKQPNSFVYRFIPVNPRDLTRGGKLQALQVSGSRGPIVFHAGNADADILSQDMQDMHTYGMRLQTRWITVHDTAVDGNSAFDANALAKIKLATPFKRPENGVFRPGSRFTEFYFDETGDTNTQTEAGDYGGFGAIMKLAQRSPSADTGVLSLFYKGDAAHSGLDNVAFWDENRIVFAEDAGDSMHTQRNALDSMYMFDVRTNYADPSAAVPLRILAQGRDASATLDSGIGATDGNGFQNDGDNEITGLHISDGDPGIGGILGAKKPEPFKEGWRVFYTQQHGDNTTFEILPRSQSERGGDRSGEHPRD